MPYIQVKVRVKPTNRPPRDLHSSMVWHACCPACAEERNPGKGPPANEVADVRATCCFCKTRMTTHRIRLAGATHVACWHNRGQRRGDRWAR